MRKIYLACPYHHDDAWIMFRRFHKVSIKAGELYKQGYNVFSPITHSHIIVQETTGISHSWDDFWEKIDFSYIKDWADELWVYRLPGWEYSRGVSAEIRFAEELGKPISYIGGDY